MAIKAYKIKYKAIWLHFKQNKITQNFNLYERASVGEFFLVSFRISALFFLSAHFYFSLALLLNQSARHSTSHECIAKMGTRESARERRMERGVMVQSIPFPTK